MAHWSRLFAHCLDNADSQLWPWRPQKFQCSELKNQLFAFTLVDKDQLLETHKQATIFMSKVTELNSLTHASKYILLHFLV